MTGISAASTLASLFQPRQSLFAKSDTDQSGTVSKDEFVAARPKDVSEADAAALYAKIDTDSTNALTEDQLKAGMEASRPARHHHGKHANGGLSDDVLSTLMNLVQQMTDSQGDSDKTKSADGRPDPADMFAKMDTNGDGNVTKAEFTAARPSNVSEDKAASFYDSIDTQGTGSITLAQFQDARPPHGAGGPHGGPPPGPPPSDTASASDATTTSTSTEDTTASSALSQSLNKLMEAIKAYASTNKIDVASLAATLTSA